LSKQLQKKAEQEANNFLADLLAKHGVKTPEKDLKVEHGEPVQPKELDDSPQRVMFHAQGILRSMDCPTEVRLTRICKNEECEYPIFTTNYASEAYCSILCAEIHLKKYFGLAWKPSARIKRERWEIRTEPEIIPMQALQAMKMIVDRVELDLGHPIPIDEEAFSRLPSGLLKPEELQPSSASESLPVSLVLHPVSDSPQNPAPKVLPPPEEDDLLSSLFAD